MKRKRINYGMDAKRATETSTAIGLNPYHFNEPGRNSSTTHKLTHNFASFPYTASKRPAAGSFSTSRLHRTTKIYALRADEPRMLVIIILGRFYPRYVINMRVPCKLFSNNSFILLFFDDIPISTFELLLYSYVGIFSIERFNFSRFSFVFLRRM